MLKFETVSIAPEMEGRTHYAPERNLKDPWVNITLNCPVDFRFTCTMETAANLRKLADQIEEACTQKARFEAAMEQVAK